ncbi:glycogen debranching enzyme [Phlebotomus argentipes]|uniref:glycogen debranching enzyme n=1 Tax=Phlebotomus argentipes TaxID=94469 RepID=UPI002892FB09|nr:glycogen debranching enzyme [Phlebotomus argentipes]
MGRQDVLSLAISHGENQQGTLFRLKRGAILHIVPGPNLLGRHIALFCNYPAKDNANFERKNYAALSWQSSNGKKLTDSSKPFVEVTDLDIYCEITANRAGAFHFYFTFQECPDVHENSLYVQVEPKIQVGRKGAERELPLDSIRCQTVMAKCLGHLQTWEDKLKVTHESGYNLLHFTPIQKLGGSRSGYSLSDQLAVNPDFGPGANYDKVAKVVKKCREEWGIASICDIVLNHTANESTWLKEHPETTYSCATCPHLRPAFLLDSVLAMASADTGAGLLETFGVPVEIDHENHINALRHQLHSNYLAKARIHELYQCNVEEYVKKFMEGMRTRPPPKATQADTKSRETIILKQDPAFGRLTGTIDFESAFDIFNVFRNDCFDEDTRLRKCAEDFRKRLEELNETVRQDIAEHLRSAVENCLSGLRYERIQDDGPRIKEISVKHPLFCRYFTDGGVTCKTVKDIEDVMYGDKAKFLMAHNGWVMNGDPLQDFARPQPTTANVYIRRELIAWGDSVKLRYGDKPEDCPYLWDHMKKYVEITAKIFDGVRLDNCHSTPLHVAEYLLDAARKINPELYVVAELFTNSDNTDNIFVNRLGITSLIREALSAWDSHEEGRLVYRFGGAPVGAFFSSPKRLLAPCIAHALFLDLTHDNPSPVQKRSVFDLLPSAALVSMACCATGSNRGYDELVPHHIHVVDEEREYQEWGKTVNAESGIIAGKKALNLLHGELAEKGFSEVFVDQMDYNIVAVTRSCPATRQSVILVAHTSFSYPDPYSGPTNVRPLRFEGHLEEIILEAGITHESSKPFDRPYRYEKDEKYINGLTEYKLKIMEHISLEESSIFSHEVTHDGNITQLNFKNLTPGSVVAVRVSLHEHTRPHFAKAQNLVDVFHCEKGEILTDLQKIVSKLNLIDLNRAVYRCDEEEKDMGLGSGTYDIPGFGRLVYCGTQGFASLLSQIAPYNDLGHPFCDNLRRGNWMMDYIRDRFAKWPGTKALSEWWDKNTVDIKEMPRYLVPSYFDVILTGLHALLRAQSVTLMSDFVRKGSSFVQALAMGTVQCVAECPSANLPALSPATKPPKPPSQCSTMSAGLPHFSTGYMRCWGRDTFISLRGLMLLTGRFDEARLMILGFGSCLRHGLVPNLLDGGYKARFNCRDAVWWWLFSIKYYVEEVPNGEEILTEKVSRIFPTDDSEAQKAGKCDQFLYDVIQEALTVHFQGLIYRERNAGPAIDAHMTEKGFNNQIGIHPDTGFVFGGNDANCGTWMDKMGSSEKAKNRGIPSTPRDGSAVELVGLQMAALRFLEKKSSQGKFPYNSVERISKNGSKTIWTYKEWADRIKASFEKNFFVGPGEIPLANKRGIYKDSCGATHTWQDFQLRPNFPIAMVAAPELFNAKHGWEALEQAKKYLLGPLGMKTLDLEDWGYRGDYNNANDSDDPRVAHGANYHQGPEWVWPIGFYLRARLIFAARNDCLKETVAETWAILTAHLSEVKSSAWRGLPELTNSNGSYCGDSCRTQAWSMATVLEVLYDLERLKCKA